MKKHIKRIIALITIISMLGCLLIGCNDKNGEEEIVKETEEVKGLPPMTEDEITLTYMCWQDIEISDALAEEFEKLYPNIDVKVKEYSLYSGSFMGEIFSSIAAGKNTPDCFWILNSPDVFISNGYLYDMTEFWENDPDADNVIKGINELKIGYYGTDRKWVTPVKFFPATAFVNEDVFIRNDVEMPDKDWIWDEFEETVEKMTMDDKVDGKHIFGMTAGCTVITWYPIASDKNCIGEFGWNGTEFDMENWAYGMNLEAKWIQSEVKPYPLWPEGVKQLAKMYGGTEESPVVLYPEEEGYSAIHCDLWWEWEDYFVTSEYIENKKVIFVPYIMPHTKDNQDGYNLATMDMGTIYAGTEHPREAYELLKFMTWGPQGWEYKLEHYPNLIETSDDSVRPVSKNHCPITLDENIWEGFKAWHPCEAIGDEYVTSLYGGEYDRSEYFEYFFDYVRESSWTCYGGQQIAGFGNWLDIVYFGHDNEHYYGYDDGLGIEAACIYGKVDALKYYEQLEKEANEIHKEKLKEIENYIKENASK